MAGTPKRLLAKTIRVDGDSASFPLIGTGKGRLVWVDAEDVRRLLEFGHSWRGQMSSPGSNLYASTTVTRNKKRTSLRLHRWLMNAPAGCDVDHIDRDTLNNRKSNLRLVDRRGNMKNLSCDSTVAASGHRNVYFHKPKGKWRVAFCIGGKFKNYGYFADVNEAIARAVEVRTRLRESIGGHSV